MDFTIGFDPRDKKRLYEYWDRILEGHRWTEAYFTEAFEERWSEYVGLPSVAFSSWSGAALAALEFFGVRDKVVLCPSNTFIATPLSVVKAGGQVEFVDCTREDLAISPDDLTAKIEEHRPAAVWVVHIGGHLAFGLDAISALCESRGIVLLEDCAHAHGASWNGRKAGTWGDAGIYSFYATKTISTGEGGMLVSGNPDLIEFAKAYRNYGKPDYRVAGVNWRMSEFTAALGLVQTDRLDDIVAWKNEYARDELDDRFGDRVRLPEGMVSGYYKYIVFEPVAKSTGKVYDQPCHELFERTGAFPNTTWVSKNHWCVPIYYRGNSRANGQ
jgi:perosamine synthetase